MASPRELEMIVSFGCSNDFANGLFSIWVSEGLADDKRAFFVYTNDSECAKRLESSEQQVILGTAEETILAANEKISLFGGKVIQYRGNELFTIKEFILDNNMSIDAPIFMNAIRPVFRGAFSRDRGVSSKISVGEMRSKYLEFDREEVVKFAKTLPTGKPFDEETIMALVRESQCIKKLLDIPENVD